MIDNHCMHVAVCVLAFVYMNACMCVCIHVCVSLTGSRSCAVKMPGRLLEIIRIPVLTSKL